MNYDNIDNDNVGEKDDDNDDGDDDDNDNDNGDDDEEGDGDDDDDDGPLRQMGMCQSKVFCSRSCLCNFSTRPGTGKQTIMVMPIVRIKGRMVNMMMVSFNKVKKSQKICNMVKKFLHFGESVLP